MRITRRTSGGRGEYEISEPSPEGLTPADLYNRRLILELADGWAIDTASVLRHQGGKRRIRMIRPECEIHPHLQVAAALLMPTPVRADQAQGTGSPVMRRSRYAIEHIVLDGVRTIGKRKALLRAKEVVIRNATIENEEIGLARRVPQIRSVWDQSEAFPEPVRALLESHKAHVQGGGPVLKLAQDIVAELQTSVAHYGPELGITYDVRSDVLAALLDALHMDLPDEPPEPLDKVPREEVEIRRRRAKEWRHWAARRGPSSAKFRHDVQRAYNFTCIVCGARLPATEANKKPGVDSAHILPWAKYDLDKESNGVSLCKLHHWAFDEGLVEIYYEKGKYWVRLGPGVEQVATAVAGGFTLNVLDQHVGEIPLARLPPNPQHRPHPKLLRRLKKELSG